MFVLLLRENETDILKELVCHVSSPPENVQRNGDKPIVLLIKWIWGREPPFEIIPVVRLSGSVRQVERSIRAGGPACQTRR